MTFSELENIRKVRRDNLKVVSSLFVSSDRRKMDFYFSSVSNMLMEFFPHAQGYVNVTANSGIGGLNYLYNYVFNYTDHLGNIRMSFTKDPVNNQLKILEENHYYPFGLKHEVYADAKQMYQLVENLENTARPTFVYKTDYQYRYNGFEYQDELGLNWYDYGARMYMPDIARWGATDNKAELYFATSPYVYALNQPTNAIDPDGNLVIFINGLGGGGKEYWKEYKRVLRFNSNFWNGSSISYRRELVSEFDVRVSYRLNDHHREYFDGSPGSLAHNISAENRYNDGYQKGLEQAATLIGSLARDTQGNITETIKIITHSMGGVYGKGFVKALKEYIKNSKDPQVRKVLITLVADFDPFQAGSKYGKADPDIYTQQFIHAGWTDITGLGGLANEKEEGVEDRIVDEKKSSHFISTFTSDISNLQEGTYTWDDKKQEWVCKECK